MILRDFAAVLGVAVLLTVLFDRAILRRGRARGLWAFFTAVLLCSWAVGAWLNPFGPRLLGVSWLRFGVTGLLFALLLAAFPVSAYAVRRGPEETRTEEGAFDVTVWFWLLIVLLALSIGWRYAAG